MSVAHRTKEAKRRGIRVLHLIDSGGIYGAERMLLNLMSRQKSLNMRPILGSIGLKGEGEKTIEAEASARGISVETFRMSRGFDIRGLLLILRFCRKRKVQIVHSHGYKSDILIGIVPKRLRKIAVVSTLHGRTWGKGFSRVRFYQLLQMLALHKIDWVVAVNNQLGEELRTIKNRVFVIENGIENITFDQHYVYKDREFLRVCSKSFVIGSVGRLSKEKGYTVLLTCLKLFKQMNLNFRVVILGEGPQRHKLQDLLHRYDLKNTVYLLGYRANAWQYIPFFDVFVLPSHFEGLPICLLEAMQAGTPIVATKVGGVPELLDYGEAGLLVSPGDPQGLADAILRIYACPSLRKKVTTNARKLILSRYSVDRMESMYYQLYISALAENKMYK